MTINEVYEFLRYVHYLNCDDSAELCEFIKKHDKAIEKKFYCNIPNTNNYITFVVSSDCYYFTFGNDFLNIKINYSLLNDDDSDDMVLQQDPFWHVAFYFLYHLNESLNNISYIGDGYKKFSVCPNNNNGFSILTYINDDNQHKLISPESNNIMISFEIPYDNLISFFIDIKEYFENYFEQWIPIIKKEKLLFGLQYDG